jgi:hypothetical protein
VAAPGDADSGSSSGKRPKEDVLTILRRVGAPGEAIRALDAELGDPVDVEEAANLLLRYGITIDWATSRMGGSP